MSFDTYKGKSYHASMIESEMIVLGIETSCDETAAAVVRAAPGVSKGEILSNFVLSQIKDHEAFGGVVPEIAARAHLDGLPRLIKSAMAQAGLRYTDLSGVAATCGPGLIGGVLVGMMAGKAIAAAHDLPFSAVNHLEGHALTPRLTDGLDFPYLLLLVSGGHTQLLVAEAVGQYHRLGTTLDDAAGECFDKSAKLMGLPFPGGPNLEKAAARCADPAAALSRFPLPRPMQGRPEPDFSFSGLKTAIRRHVETFPEGVMDSRDIADLSYSFQTAAAAMLADRCTRAMAMFRDLYPGTGNPALVISGGVAANGMIRERLSALCTQRNFRMYAPPLSLCSDNAAMIAWAGIERLRLGMRDSLDFKARPRWPLDPAAAPRHGAGVKA